MMQSMIVCACSLLRSSAFAAAQADNLAFQVQQISGTSDVFVIASIEGRSADPTGGAESPTCVWFAPCE